MRRARTSGGGRAAAAAAAAGSTSSAASGTRRTPCRASSDACPDATRAAAPRNAPRGGWARTRPGRGLTSFSALVRCVAAGARLGRSAGAGAGAGVGTTAARSTWTAARLGQQRVVAAAAAAAAVPATAARRFGARCARHGAGQVRARDRPRRPTLRCRCSAASAPSSQRAPGCARPPLRRAPCERRVLELAVEADQRLQQVVHPLADDEQLRRRRAAGLSRHRLAQRRPAARRAAARRAAHERALRQVRSASSTTMLWSSWLSRIDIGDACSPALLRCCNFDLWIE